MQFHMFDEISDEPQIDRTRRVSGLAALLQMVTNTMTNVHEVPTFKASTQGEIDDLLNLFLRHKYEGIILRHASAAYQVGRSRNLLKIKPVLRMKATIRASVEEVSILGEPKNALGAFLVDFENGAPGYVGSGFTREEREKYWRTDMKGKTIRVRYHELSDGGVPCPAIFQEVL